jgi:hypothetical protein
VTGAAEYADIAKLIFRERQKAKKFEVFQVFLSEARKPDFLARGSTFS